MELFEALARLLTPTAPSVKKLGAPGIKRMSPELEKKMRRVGAAGAMKPKLERKEHLPPLEKMFRSPAQRDYPGRTNYGVPEDNMIDTPQGYITRQLYNQRQQPQSRVSMGYGMQPFGNAIEDQWTAHQSLQPVDYNTNQVSMYGPMMQGGVPMGGLQAPQGAGDLEQLRRLRRPLGY